MTTCNILFFESRQLRDDNASFMMPKKLNSTTMCVYTNLRDRVRYTQNLRNHNSPHEMRSMEIVFRIKTFVGHSKNTIGYIYCIRFATTQL